MGRTMALPAEFWSFLGPKWLGGGGIQETHPWSVETLPRVSKGRVLATVGSTRKGYVPYLRACIIPFTVTFFICITMYLNVDVEQFQVETAKLPHIHVQIHCNANEKTLLWKGLLPGQYCPVGWNSIPLFSLAKRTEKDACHCNKISARTETGTWTCAPIAFLCFPVVQFFENITPGLKFAM